MSDLPKPCPCCKESKVSVARHEGIRVACSGCGMHSGAGLTDADAIEWWNRRPYEDEVASGLAETLAAIDFAIEQGPECKTFLVEWMEGGAHDEFPEFTQALAAKKIARQALTIHYAANG